MNPGKEAGRVRVTFLDMVTIIARESNAAVSPIGLNKIGHLRGVQVPVKGT
jgi:hypothetical protein